MRQPKRRSRHSSNSKNNKSNKRSIPHHPFNSETETEQNSSFDENDDYDNYDDDVDEDEDQQLDNIENQFGIAITNNDGRQQESDLRWDSLTVAFIAMMTFYPLTYFFVSSLEGVSRDPSEINAALNNFTNSPPQDTQEYDHQKELFLGVMDSYRAALAGSVINLALIQFIVVTRVTKVWFVDLLKGEVNRREIMGALLQIITFVCIVVVFTMDARQLAVVWRMNMRSPPFVCLAILFISLILSLLNILSGVNAVLRSLGKSREHLWCDRFGFCRCFPCCRIMYKYFDERRDRLTKEVATEELMKGKMMEYETNITFLMREFSNLKEENSRLRKRLENNQQGSNRRKHSARFWEI